MSSPANRSEVLAASDTEPVITGEAPQAEEPSAIKVFFTAPGSKSEFYHLSPNTTGWDIVTEKGCFAQVDTSNLRKVHRSTTIDLSSKIMEHLPDLREGDTVEELRSRMLLGPNPVKVIVLVVRLPAHRILLTSHLVQYLSE